MMQIPFYVNKILHKLHTSGYEAFVVGGCVRDALMGVAPCDWDICTSALPNQVIDLFKEKHTVIPTGLQHGTITIISEGNQIEVTTYRSDGEYDDNRHPEKVVFLPSVEGDLARRDFTMNSIAYNPKDGLIDLFGGIADIHNKTIRCVGNPEKRFEEDALRIM
ncbi:MAG: polynucleotide adenylyltransferase, partial [Clostridia bacterium]|nr:polynucleotide adenylyltransferase [Clostridia bacterium]